LTEDRTPERRPSRDSNGRRRQSGTDLAVTAPDAPAAYACGSQHTRIWFPIGGTRLAAPLVSAIVANCGGAMGAQTGQANALFFALFNRNASDCFHDIRGSGSATNENGDLTTTSNYDMATGTGPPTMSALITGIAQD